MDIVHRRHITKGAQAMAVAIVHPEPEKGGRGKKTIVSNNSIESDVLSRARTILRIFGPDSDIVKQIMHGGSLADGYRLAQERKRAPRRAPLGWRV